MNEFTTIKVSKETVGIIKEISHNRGLKHTAAQIVDEAVRKMYNEERIPRCIDGEIELGDTLKFTDRGDKNSGTIAVVNKITSEAVYYGENYSLKGDGALWRARIIAKGNE